MADREAFAQDVRQLWAAHFGCPAERLEQPGTTILPEPKYAGDNLAALWQIGARTFAQVDPQLADAVQRITDGLPAGTGLTADDLARAWGAAAIQSRDAGIVNYLFPPDLSAWAPRSPYTVRALTLADDGGMQDLHAACAPAEVDDGYVEVNHEIAFGCFADGALVAASSGYRRTGFMDIGVLTHPAHRRRGLGKAVVGALCAWSIARNVINQYRCNADNLGSRTIALGLGFRQFLTSESLRLR
jgi:GNAT superfamily N-acetyltransferase